MAPLESRRRPPRNLCLFSSDPHGRRYVITGEIPREEATHVDVVVK